MKIPFKLIPGLLLVIIIVSITVINFKKQSDSVEERLSKFQLLSVNDSLNNQINIIHNFSDLKGVASGILVTLDDGSKYKIGTIRNNLYSNDSSGIQYVVNTGDRLIKKAGNDTLYIDKAKTSKSFDYFFVLQNTKQSNF